MKNINYEKTLAYQYPALVEEWHPVKNGNLTPQQISAHSHYKAWWIRQFDVPNDQQVESIRGKHFDFEWQATVANRSYGTNCPFLSGYAVWPGFNDLTTVNPDLASEWNYTKNRFTPMRYTNKSNRKAWWKCENGHEQYSKISNRSGQGTRCQICAKIQKANGGSL